MKILIAGDLVTQNRIRDIITGDHYHDLLSEVRPYTESSDYSILNFETTMEDPSRRFRPIPKVGPHISSPANTLEMIKEAGFQCVTLANNHILDYGGDALLHTVRAIEEKGLDHVGAGKDLEAASKVLVKRIGEADLAIVNFCEDDFSIAGEHDPGACPMDLVKILRQLRWAKDHADHVIVIAHGGIELYPLPSPRMKELYRTFVDLGADAVVNHHQHCHSGYEVYNGKPIFYGLGNLLFDRKKYSDPLWNYGYMVRLDIGEDIGFEAIPYSQCLDRMAVSVLHGAEREKFMEGLASLNRQIADDAELQNQYEKLVSRKYRQVLMRLSPFSGKSLASLAQKGWIKIAPREKKALGMMEYLTCDAHRDLARNVLSRYIGNDKK